MSTVDRRTETLRALQPYIERARSFSGWTFDDVRKAPLDPDPPWDYQAVAREHVAVARDVLDMGTGGGEVLSQIVAGRDARVVATEHWHVNAPIARDRLRPLGGHVVRANNLRLPFRDAAFDLVLNRHEELDPADVVRVLRGGGAIVTQQVGHNQWEEQRRFFPRRTVWPDHFVTYRRGFEAAGMRVEAMRHEQRVAYATLGDVVFMMLITPWEVPDFDPDAEIDALLAMEDALGGPQGIVFTEVRYLIAASGR
ncbi:MAG: class I SAM-dependent methyltransferase [Dehalococcoidia bacterium]